MFPSIFIPFATRDSKDEFYLHDKNAFGLVVLSFVSILELVLIIVAIPAFVVLPGVAIFLTLVLGVGLIHLLCWPIQGPQKAQSQTPSDPDIVAKHQRCSSERWFFLNGCCVTDHALKQNLNLLSDTFGRPVLGIHNRTYGIVGDLVECLIQRALGFYSQETRVAYEYVKSYCADPAVTKVVLIAHSQGGIMAAEILDQLFADLPSDSIAKLEVYTFGNAASHFNNPLRTLKSSRSNDDNPATVSPASPKSLISPMTPLGGTPASPKLPSSFPYLPERVIRHMEHYCNSEDMVTRWGVLYSAKSILNNRFCGHIFIDEGATGHMLNQHYLAKMFPMQSSGDGGGAFQREQINSGNSQGASADREVPFLDKVVEVDAVTVAKRTSEATKQLGVMRQDSVPLDPPGTSAGGQTQTNGDRNSNGHLNHAVVDIEPLKDREGTSGLELGDRMPLRQLDLKGVEGSRISIARAEREGEKGVHGKTVRDLSRLWKYVGGRDPDA